jgi:hypothetical protein
MCPEIPVSQVKGGVDEQRKDEGKQNAALSNHCCAEEVLFQTLQGSLEANGKKRTVRALIDTGSQLSYILKKTAEEMRYKPVASESLIRTLFGGAASQREDHQCYDVRLCSLTSGYSCKIQGLDQPALCSPTTRLRSSCWIGELEETGIQLSDVGGGKTPIDTLIGNDVGVRLYTGNLVGLRCGLVAVQTWFEWVVVGRIKVRAKHDTQATMMTTLLTQANNIEDLAKV